MSLASAGSSGAVAASRVYGHGPAKGVGEDDEIVQRMRGVMTGEKQRRRATKAALAAELYRSRARFDPSKDREALRGEGAGEFLSTEFGMGGAHQRGMAAAQVTHQSVRDAIHGQEWAKDVELEHAEASHETHVKHKGKHVYTLYHGASAFVDVGKSAAGRNLVKKHGAPEKDYVRDDVGVPTRRYAYAVKDPGQVGVLRGGNTLAGRYLLPHDGEAPLGDDIMRGTEGEKNELRPRKGPHEPLTEDEMLFFHQEYGTGHRQRGISLSSSPAPLLSNEARGFAQEHPSDARKLRIDLATVAPRANTPDAPPNLRNLYHQIPGFPRPKVPKVKMASAQRGQARFDWSTGKNRELFLRQLTQANVSGTAAPSPLETMRYYPRPGELPALEPLKAEYERVRRGTEYTDPL